MNLPLSWRAFLQVITVLVVSNQGYNVGHTKARCCMLEHAKERYRITTGKG